MTPETFRACIAWEGGELDEPETIKLFAELIATKEAWKLQGFYGRAADQMIMSGVISKTGVIAGRYKRKWALLEAAS